ncbi:TPA: hypothetical protein ACH6EP_002860, partial [Enterococcus faecium]
KKKQIFWSFLSLGAVGVEPLLTKWPDDHIGGCRSTPLFLQIPKILRIFSSATDRQNCKQF